MEHTSTIPAGLTKCASCGEYNGKVRAGDLNNKWSSIDPEKLVGVTCLCHGILCMRCGRNKIHRPISNEYDPTTNEVWHTPYFAGCIPCAECRKEEQAKASGQERTDWNSPFSSLNHFIRLLSNVRRNFHS